MHYDWIEIPIKPYEQRYQYDSFQSVFFITFQFVPMLFWWSCTGTSFSLTYPDRSKYLYSICLKITRNYSVDWFQIYLTLIELIRILFRIVSNSNSSLLKKKYLQFHVHNCRKLVVNVHYKIWAFMSFIIFLCISLIQHSKNDIYSHDKTVHVAWY